MGEIAGYGFRFGGGTSIGALPFAIRSTDSLPAIFTSTAARDTYYTTNPGDIAAGTDLANRQAAIGIGPTDGNPVGVTAAFIRNTSNTGWVAIATNFVGQTGATGPAGPTGPSGNPLADEEITADLTISATTPNNIATYRNKNVINTRTAAGDVTVTLDTIASFLAATPNDDFVIQFINDSSTGNLFINADPANRISRLAGGVTLAQGEACKLKLPLTGTVWLLLSESTDRTAGGTPQRPTTIPQGNVVLQTPDWDASSGSFPAGASQGNLYRVGTSGTVDSITFSVGDFIIALVNSPSTTTFAANWGSLEEDDVHSWAGMQGVITDAEITSVLNRLGFDTDDDAIHDNVAGEIAAITEKTSPVAADILLIEDSEDSNNKKRIAISSLSAANVPRPSLHNFSISIASRVDLNTDLNVQQTVTFEVSNHSQLTALELDVSAGTNQTLTLPTTDGSQSQTVTLAGISTASAGSVGFRLIGTYAGGTVESNQVIVTIANLQTQEFAYYGSLATTAAFGTEDLGNLTSVDVSNTGTTYNLAESVPNGEFFGIISPADRDPVSIFNTVSNRFAYNPSDPSVTPSFTLQEGIRTINSTQYNLLYTQNNSGFTATVNYRVVTE